MLNMPRVASVAIANVFAIRKVRPHVVVSITSPVRNSKKLELLDSHRLPPAHSFRDMAIRTTASILHNTKHDEQNSEAATKRLDIFTASLNQPLLRASQIPAARALCLLSSCCGSHSN